MAEKCPQCNNQTLYDGRCMSCKYDARSPASLVPTRKQSPTPTKAPQPGSQSSAPPIISPPWSTTPNVNLVPPVNPIQISPTNPLTPASPAIQLANWPSLRQPTPTCEGRVDSITGPHQHQTRPPWWQELLGGWFLGKINPWLAQGAYMRRRDYFVWNCRLIASNGQHFHIEVQNRLPTLGFSQGDTVAIWDEASIRQRQRLQANAGTNVRLVRAYNYNTKTWYDIET